MILHVFKLVAQN